MRRRSMLVVALSLHVLSPFLVGCSLAWEAPVSVPPVGSGELTSVSPLGRSLAFMPNVGQIAPAFVFATASAGSRLYFARDQVVLPMLSSGKQAGVQLGQLPEQSDEDSTVLSQPPVVRLRFEGTNPDSQVVGEKRLRGIVNYFIGDDPTGWHTHIPTYAGIVYLQLYPGIDLLYNGQDGALKGTFIVAPGANPADIRWYYEGASGVELEQGELLIHTGGDGEANALIEGKPVAWQAIGDSRQPVDVRYLIHNDGSIGFALGQHDVTRSLRIDPTLKYASQAGGSGCEAAFGMASFTTPCRMHLTVFGGRTTSASSNGLGPAASDADADLFVTMVDPSAEGGDQMIYTTYIGGSQKDTVHGLAVDALGYAYVAGYSRSIDFPTTAGAFQPTYGGGWQDGILIKVAPWVGVPTYASYLGGGNDDDAIQVDVDTEGKMFVTGYTTSRDFPTTENAYDRELGGDTDAFVAIVDPSQTGNDSLVYSTFFGGSLGDEGWTLEEHDGIVYLAGNTKSTDLPRKDALYPTYSGESSWAGDAYIAKLDPSQTGDAQLLYGTYIGGTSDDISGGVTVDDAGNMYLCGATSSSDFPTTSGSQAYGGGTYDGFVLKLNADGQSLRYSILLGGRGNDGLRGIAVDSDRYTYVTGGTGSDDFPLVYPLQEAWGGGSGYEGLGPGDAVVAQIDPSGVLAFSTYLGGSGDDAGLDLTLDDESGDLCVVGASSSPDLVTVNPYQESHRGNFDSYIVIIGFGPPPPTPTATATPTQTPTHTRTAILTPTDTPTATPTPTYTRTVILTPTDTPTAAPTPTNTLTPTRVGGPHRLYLPLVLKNAR